MQIFNSFDIVIVPFPFTDQATVKKRPALVISKPSFQQSSHHLILMMITSAKNSRWLDDINITNSNKVGLPVPSIIRFKMFTLDARFILKKVGVLQEIDQSKVQNQLVNIIACEKLPLTMTVK